VKDMIDILSSLKNISCVCTMLFYVLFVKLIKHYI